MKIDRTQLCPFGCRCAEAADKIERLQAAGKKIIEADDQFRASLGPHWDGDPVSDACEAARDLFCLNQQPASSSLGKEP